MPVLPKLNKYFIVSIFKQKTYSSVFQDLFSNPFLGKLSAYQNPWASLLQRSWQWHTCGSRRSSSAFWIVGRSRVACFWEPSLVLILGLWAPVTQDGCKLYVFMLYTGFRILANPEVSCSRMCSWRDRLPGCYLIVDKELRGCCKLVLLFVYRRRWLNLEAFPSVS